MCLFSPPDMTEAEADEVREAILSGWITTGPRTKKLEKEVAEFVGADKAVCLNSQTACAEMALRLLGIGKGRRGDCASLYLYGQCFDCGACGRYAGVCGCAERLPRNGL